MLIKLAIQRKLACFIAWAVLMSGVQNVSARVPNITLEPIGGNPQSWELHRNDNQDKVALNTAVHDFTATATWKGAGSIRAYFSVHFPFADWSTNNWVFAPGVVYGGNRFRILPLHYPPYIYNPTERPLDMPLTTGPIPHLSRNGADGRIDVRTTNLTAPCFGFYNPAIRVGFLIMTDAETSCGITGLEIEESPSNRFCRFSLTAPAHRFHVYHMLRLDPGKDPPALVPPNGKIAVRCRVYEWFNVPNVAAYLDCYLSIRKDFTGPTGPDCEIAPFSFVAATILNHSEKFKFYEDKTRGTGYLCNRPEEDNPFNQLQVGWGGAPVCFLPYLAQPNTERLRQIALTFDTICKMQAPSTGLFHAIYCRGELLGDNFNQMYFHRTVSMARRQGLTLYFGLQTLEIMETRGIPCKPEWEASLRRCADGLVALYRKYGQFGQEIDVKTGSLEVNGSSNGAICIGALAFASQHFNTPSYLRIAEEAGRFYYRRDVAVGYAGGAPSENGQSPDSEASSEFIESYITLFELTRQPEWLCYAKASAALFSTWETAYDTRFPRNSVCGRWNVHSTGSVWASTQNAHGAPGLYVLSGDCLLKLYRATGDPRYLNLDRDTAHGIVQYVTLPNRKFVPHGRPGAVSERVNISDWEGASQVGGNITDNDTNFAWENVALLSILQNPGIYAETDTGFLAAFDHVRATWACRPSASIPGRLAIENPTTNDAKVSILAETAASARTNSLGWQASFAWPRVNVPAHGRIIVNLARLADTPSNLL